MDKKILAIGELLIDGITDSPVQDLSQATALKLYPGGSPGNFSRYLHRLGIPVRLIATVGQDGFGKILLQRVREEGFDTTGIHQSKRYHTSFIAVARTSNTPDFIAYRDADMHIGKVNESLICTSSLVHTTAFALSRDPARKNILQALETASQQGIPVSVDWNYATPIWGTENESAQVFARLQQFRPLFKFSLDDVERFTGRKTIAEACDWLNSIESTCICLTCGSKGVYYRSMDTSWQFQPAEKIEVKNATGAGDAFWAGFISTYGGHLFLEDAVANGIRVASMQLQNKWQTV